MRSLIFSNRFIGRNPTQNLLTINTPKRNVSFFHPRASLMHQNSNPPPTWKSPFAHSEALTDQQRQHEPTLLLAMLKDDKLSKWGWITLRTTYTALSDELWPKYQSIIKTAAHNNMNSSCKEHLSDSSFGLDLDLDPAVIDSLSTKMDFGTFVSDPETLNGRCWREADDFFVRRYFLEWAERTEREENPLMQLEHVNKYGRSPRYVHFLLFDEGCVRRMLAADTTGGYEPEWIDIIRCDPRQGDFGKWEGDPYDVKMGYATGPPEDEDNMGWIKLTTGMLGPAFYADVYGTNDIWYIYDKEQHTPVWYY
ncbi:hypothetical protein QBC44DRAFT_397173 [Cladorrhinum sp. PSN332]|nr:hypothetical protein QBC44DRAFT_397173 [Cladorrhinum sp. PSN332]